MNKESQNIEWKSSWRDDYLKWISGFANANGGILYIGIDDSGKIKGIDNSKKLLEDLPNKIRDILGVYAQVNLLEKDNKQYIEIVVDAYTSPISYKGRFYYRSGSTLQELKGEALQKLILQKTGKKWDGFPADGFTHKDLKPMAFEIFKKKATRSKRVPIEDLEKNNNYLLDLLGLTDKNILKRAAILTFGKNPEKLVPGAYVKIGFFHSHTDLMYQDEIHGSLFEQVEKTMDLLLTKYLKANIAYEGLTRTETYDYPENALREALLNALIHKDYSSGNPVQISVYANMLIISNTGLLPFGWTTHTLTKKHRSEPANPDIANVFFRAGYIEVWGRGTLNIIKYCKDAGLPEPEFQYDSGLTVTFKLGKNSERIRKEHGKDIEKIFLLIKENPHITANELANKLAKSQRTIEKHIKKLKDNSFIKRIGPKLGGHWEIINND